MGEKVTVENDRELKEILLATKTIASVGASSNKDKPSYWIFLYLKEQGFRMLPVNPSTPEIQGEKSYTDLDSLPEQVDLVQVFRRPEDIPPIVDAAIRIGVKTIWMQEGIVNLEAAKKAEMAGLKVVMNRCMMKTHQRLIAKP